MRSGVQSGDPGHDPNRTARMTTKDHTVAAVYYDGSCPLCTAEIGHYRRCAGADAITFVDVSSPGAEPGPDLSQDAAMARFHVRTGDGALLSGAAGFAALWSTLPGWRWVGRAASHPAATKLLEHAYRAFLPVRPALARLVGRLQR